MGTKLNCVLLVDDDEITNFLNKQTLEDANITQNIEIAETAKDALALLECPRVEKCKSPDLILLDLNMPGLTGWDFIDEYKKIKDLYGIHSVIIILTTSTNPDEKQKAYLIDEVAGFKSKPLTYSMINEIIQEHFNI